MLRGDLMFKKNKEVIDEKTQSFIALKDLPTLCTEVLRGDWSKEVASLKTTRYRLMEAARKSYDQEVRNQIEAFIAIYMEQFEKITKCQEAIKELTKQVEHLLQDFEGVFKEGNFYPPKFTYQHTSLKVKLSKLEEKMDSGWERTFQETREYYSECKHGLIGFLSLKKKTSELLSCEKQATKQKRLSATSVEVLRTKQDLYLALQRGDIECGEEKYALLKRYLNKD